MELLYIIIGVWCGVILAYFEWYKPMSKRIENLENKNKE